MLLNLPQEILDEIISHVHTSAGGLGWSLLPCSLTCKALRQIALQYLFETITLTTQSSVWDAHSHEYIELLAQPLSGLAQNVRHVRILNPVISKIDPQFLREIDDDVASREPIGNLTMLNTAFGRMTGLRSLTFDDEKPLTKMILELPALRQRNIDVIVDGRRSLSKNLTSDLKTCLYIQSYNQIRTWRTSSIAQDESTRNIQLALWERPIASLHWELLDEPNARIDASVQNLVQILNNTPTLQELHLSDKRQYLIHGSQSAPYAPLIADAVSTLTNLTHLSIEVSGLSEHILPILPTLSRLSSLRIYSAHRNTFHPSCDANLYTAGPPLPLSYLSLPSLHHLDIRYICAHLPAPTFLPPNLISLRIEHYHHYDQLSLPTLQHLAHTSPHLKRLEFDIGPLSELSLTPTAPTTHFPDTHPNIILRALSPFKNLQTLRLFPSYWHAARLRATPISRKFVAQIFTFLRRHVVPSLHTLHISMSFGDFPVTLVPDMPYYARPVKHVAREVEEGKVLVTCNAAQTDFDVEYLFEELEGEGEEGQRYMLRTERRVEHRWFKQFFDDLHTEWQLPYMELPDEAWLVLRRSR